MIVYFWFTLKETFKDYQQLMKIFNVSQTKYYNINTWINKNGYLFFPGLERDNYSYRQICPVASII